MRTYRRDMRRRDISGEAMAAVAQVFDEMGGINGLLQWALKNPDKFYTQLWPRLLPKHVEAVFNAEVVSGQVGSLPAVQVADVSTALNALERLRYASDAHSGRWRDGDEWGMDGGCTPHEACVPETYGGGTRPEQAHNSADATATRQDNLMCIDPAISLPNHISVAGDNVCDSLSRPSE